MANNLYERRKALSVGRQDLNLSGNNRSERIPVCFLIDCSDSNDLILREIAHELGYLTDHIQRDLGLRSSVEIMVITYADKPQVLREFLPIQGEYHCVLKKKNVEEVSICLAMQEACNRVRRQKQIYRTRGVNYFQPTVFLFSSGRHEADTAPLEAICKNNTRPGYMSLVSVTRSRDELFERISSRGRVFSLHDVPIKELFRKIENSMEIISQSSGAAYETLMDAARECDL